ncbi:MAG: hypothetical protein HY329_07825 [Chloroflexi bacterium]|nr:hypothetical protein [Chloroflexota bacterium]
MRPPLALPAIVTHWCLPVLILVILACTSPAAHSPHLEVAPKSTALRSAPAAAAAGLVAKVEGEALRGLVAAPGGDYRRVAGWTTYTMDFYSGGMAALTRYTGGEVRADIPDLAPGDYRVTVVVYDYGTGDLNQIAVWLNGVERTLGWSAHASNLRQLKADMIGTNGGSDLSIRALERQQEYIIVDRIMIEALTPASSLEPEPRP